MSSPQHEPTMEEILASIRKIISEDNPPEAAPAPKPVAAAPAPAPAPEPAPQPEMEVLELTQEVAERHARTYPGTAPGRRDHRSRARATRSCSSRSRRANPRRQRHRTMTSSPIIPARRWKTRSTPSRRGRRTGGPSRGALQRPVDGASVESVFERAVRESFEPVLQKYLSDNSAAGDRPHEAPDPRMDGREFPAPAGRRRTGARSNAS